jgi:hypothetical protein
MSDPIIIAAIRVTDMPTPHFPSIKHNCSECGEPCWVSEETEGFMMSKVAERMVCIQCVPILSQKETE